MFKTLKKYLRLAWSFFRVSLVADLEFRINFVGRIFTDIFWYLAQILTFEALYLHTDLIGAWNVDQMRVFLGLIFVADAIFMVLFFDNLDHLSEKVRKGQLDLLLTKPVNSQFMVSLQRMAPALLGNFILGFAWLCWALSRLPDLSLPRLLWLIVLIPCGVIALYGTRFSFASLAVIFTQSQNLQYLWYQTYKLGMKPDAIYVPWLRFLVLTLVPMGLIASVPARAVLEPPDYWLFGWVICLAGIMLYISHRVWRFALKFYTSASS